MQLNAEQRIVFSNAVKALPETHRKMIAQTLEHYYYVAREEYADGSGEASPEQSAVSELQEIVRS